MPDTINLEDLVPGINEFLESYKKLEFNEQELDLKEVIEELFEKTKKKLLTNQDFVKAYNENSVEITLTEYLSPYLLNQLAAVANLVKAFEGKQISQVSLNAENPLAADFEKFAIALTRQISIDIDNVDEKAKFQISNFIVSIQNDEEFWQKFNNDTSNELEKYFSEAQKTKWIAVNNFVNSENKDEAAEKKLAIALTRIITLEDLVPGINALSGNKNLSQEYKTELGNIQKNFGRILKDLQNNEEFWKNFNNEEFWKNFNNEEFLQKNKALSEQLQTLIEEKMQLDGSWNIFKKFIELIKELIASSFYEGTTENLGLGKTYTQQLKAINRDLTQILSSTSKQSHEFS